MYVLQIADFHIDPTADCKKYENKIERLLQTLQCILPSGSEMLCCLLGDFSDRGNPDAFKIAMKVLADFKEKFTLFFKDSKLEYEIVPGNHDLCCCTKEASGKKDLSAFNEFASRLLERRVDFTSKTIAESTHFGYHFISVNTIISNETSYGSIDFNTLESANADSGCIVIAHHGVVSSDETDTSSIRNGYRLHQFLESKECSAFLHGHTHGYKRYTVGHGCQVVGVGPMFKNEGEYDISNQCNLIKLTSGQVSEITTLSYQGDRDTWDAIPVYVKPEDNSYLGSDAYALYCRVLKDARENQLLPNFCIQIQTSYADFEKNITENFKFCRDDAIAWQSVETSEYFEFTHGQQMNAKELSWQEFVVGLLRQNPTTKRAIIPLIDKEKAFHAADDEYLVSLDIVQIGFASDACKTLYITVYMRALEIGHFLPTNLYEIYLISQIIKEKFPSIEKINVCLFAYRAEVKENYGCFKKAEIDVIRESMLCKYFNSKDYAAIVTLLNQKSKMGETVIDNSWLIRLTNAVTDFYEAENKKSILDQINIVKEKLDMLKTRRAHCSDYSITQAEESEYCTEIGHLISLFQEII